MTNNELFDIIFIESLKIRRMIIINIYYKSRCFNNVEIPQNEFFESACAVDCLLIFKSKQQKESFLEIVDDNKNPSDFYFGTYHFANCYFYGITNSARIVKGHLEKCTFIEESDVLF